MKKGVKKDYIYPLILLCVWFIVTIWTLINPKYGYVLWLEEAAPALIGLTILILTYKKFRFSNITYTFIFLEACVLVIGGKWSYAENPLFEWFKITWDLQRNYYDRLGHLLQGMIPALVAFELLVKKSVVKGKKWLIFIIVSIVLAISAFYEFIEWWAALIQGVGADVFLGAQGDVWDSHWDMFIAFIGGWISILVIVPLTRLKGLIKK